MTRAAPKHAPRVPFALLVTGLIVGGLCALLGLNTASAANELNRHDLATRDTAVALQVQALRNEVAASAAPGALASAAAQIGMVPATDPAFLVIGANGTVRVMGSPGPVVYVPPPPTIAPATGPTPTASKAAVTPTTVTPTTVKPSTTKASTSVKPSTKPKPSTSVKPSPKPSTTPTPTTSLPGGPR